MKTLTSLGSSLGVIATTFRYVQKSKAPNADIEVLKSEFTQEIFEKLKIELETKGTPYSDPSMLYVGNHISYLDILLLMKTTPKLSFVAKYELSLWPIFGAAARRVDTVFVKRENKDSRKETRKSVYEALEQGRRVVIFPSGSTCLGEKKPWKKGAFEIAYDLGISVQPFRLSYEPLRKVAYIDDDTFFPHMLDLFKQQKIKAKIEFHEPVKIKDPIQDALYWHQWSRGLVNNESDGSAFSKVQNILTNTQTT